MNEQRKPITLRLSEAERKTMAAVAKESGETLTGWMRRTLIAAAKKLK